MAGGGAPLIGMGIGMIVVGLASVILGQGTGGGALALLMGCALYFVHLGHGLFAAEGGIEYPLVLLMSLLMIVIFGSGRASMDGVLSNVDA